MPDGRTMFGDISPRTAAYAQKRLLTRGDHIMLTERFADVKELPTRSSQTMVFRRFLSLDPALTPLSEGVTPTAQKLTKEDITVILKQYGNLVEWTDVIEDTHEDPVLQQAMDLMGENAAETKERLNIGVMTAGTNVMYSTSTARDAVISKISRGLLRNAVRSLKKQKASFISQMIGAGVNVSTVPVEQGFFALGHTDLEPDIRDLSGFKSVAEYASQGSKVPGEIGVCESVRFALSALWDPWEGEGAAVSTSGMLSTGGYCDVYPVVILARNCYALTPLKGKNSVTPIVLNPSKPDKSDPLGQIGYVGWKTWHASVILNELWMMRLEVACTATPA